MPARVVRGEINSSQSLARVSIAADLTFRALIAAVDDYGRLDARLPFLKAQLFPMRDEATLKKLSAWLAELAAEGCIRLYKVDGRPYLELTGWEKHRGKTRRASDSKYPKPPPGRFRESPGDSGRSEDLHADPSESRESGVGSRETRDERGDPPPSGRPVGFPLEASEERELLRQRLSTWKPKHREPLSPDEIDHLIETVGDWYAGKPAARARADWAAVCRNATKPDENGVAWGLKGFSAQHARDRREVDRVVSLPQPPRESFRLRRPGPARA